MHTIGACSLKGKRDYQQDRIGSWGTAIDGVTVSCIALADGMGGHNDGHESAVTAISVLGQEWEKIVSINHLPSKDQIEKFFLAGFQKANHRIAEFNSLREHSNSGTTLVCAVVVGFDIYIANVGDSRAYLITEDGCKQITKDHSALQDAIDRNQITIQDIGNYPYKNVLTRCLDGTEKSDADHYSIEGQKDWVLVLCSDGVTDVLGQHDFVRLLSLSNDLDEFVLSICKTAVYELESSDNTSALVLTPTSVSKKKSNSEHVISHKKPYMPTALIIVAILLIIGSLVGIENISLPGKTVIQNLEISNGEAKAAVDQNRITEIRIDTLLNINSISDSSLVVIKKGEVSYFSNGEVMLELNDVAKGDVLDSIIEITGQESDNLKMKWAFDTGRHYPMAEPITNEKIRFISRNSDGRILITVEILREIEIYSNEDSIIYFWMDNSDETEYLGRLVLRFKMQ